MDSASIRDPDGIFEYMMRFVNVERGQKTAFKLDRMRLLCELAGEPQRAFDSVHVAGSKGKGSVATMISLAMESAGRATGLYTSPHVESFTERVTRAGNPLSDESYVKAGRALVEIAEKLGDGSFPGSEPPTYFELMTLFGFIAFRDEGFPWASIETGLGGRLDSTNVIVPRAVALTPIELEHTEYLGDTIELIAGEKAGIMKPGVPAVSSPQSPRVREVFREAAKARGCELHFIDEIARVVRSDVSREGTEVEVRFSGGPLEGSLAARIPMPGRAYAWNAAVAAAALRLADPGVSLERAADGFSRARLPARFEIRRKEGVYVVFEGAHTPVSVELALATFAELFPGRRTLLFACAKDKRHEDIATALPGGWEAIVVTRPGTFKASDPEEAFASFENAGLSPRLVPDTTEAAREAFEIARKTGSALLVTGSFYLCAEAKRALAPLDP